MISFKPRYYQSEAVDSLLSARIKHKLRRALAVLPTGAGKAWVCALLADWLSQEHVGGKILMLVPTQDLVLQNREKLELLGLKASLWCGSLGPKNTKRQIVIGTPQSVGKNIDYLLQQGFVACIFDEAHGLHPTNVAILERFEAHNPEFFTLGMTATPFRTGEGWIFKDHYQYGVTPADQANDPFFDRVVYEISPRPLIAEGFLCPPFSTEQLDSYDEDGLEMKDGMFTRASLDRVYTAQKNRTERIVADVIRNSEVSRSVLIFAASKKHAQQIIACLPPGEVGYVDGSMRPHERKKSLEDFKEFRTKYLVNVNVLTTGFDHAALDHVVIMRAMESVLLWLQMVGRGLRIAEGKDGFQLSDYGGNIASFFPEGGDIFSPEIKASYRGAPLSRIEVECPECRHKNSAAISDENLDKPRTPYGYLLDDFGEPMEMQYPFVNAEGKVDSETRPVPAHHQQRCAGMSIVNGERVQCDHFWNFKRCGYCQEKNPLSARVCRGCHEVLIDVAQKLKEERAEIRAMVQETRAEEEKKKAIVREVAAQDPHAPRTAPVAAVVLEYHVTRQNKNILKAVIKLPRPLGSLEVFLHKGSHQRQMFCDALFSQQFDRDTDLLKRFETKVPWLRPRLLESITWRVPRGKQRYPDIISYDVEVNA